MRVYLVQHGVARPKEEDPDRPLTDDGRREVEQVSQAAGSLGIEVSTIFHSGKARAQQTAEIFANHLNPDEGCVAVSGIGPTDDPETARLLVAQSKQPVMLVGHLPHLGRLASLLITGDPARAVLAFHNAGLVCLASTEGRWTVDWVLTPQIASSRNVP
jgi:phosphohistidine phosphatase